MSGRRFFLPYLINPNHGKDQRRNIGESPENIPILIRNSRKRKKIYAIAESLITLILNCIRRDPFITTNEKWKYSFFFICISFCKIVLPVIGSISAKLRWSTSSGPKPSTATCTDRSASRKCGFEAIIGNGIDNLLPLTMAKNKFQDKIRTCRYTHNECTDSARINHWANIWVDVFYRINKNHHRYCY